jgi:hypothetical protein
VQMVPQELQTQVAAVVVVELLAVTQVQEL